MDGGGQPGSLASDGNGQMCVYLPVCLSVCLSVCVCERVSCVVWCGWVGERESVCVCVCVVRERVWVCVM